MRGCFFCFLEREAPPPSPGRLWLPRERQGFGAVLFSRLVILSSRIEHLIYRYNKSRFAKCQEIFLDKWTI